MLQYELLRERGILILKPEVPLSAEDFAALAGAVDPYIEQHGDLKGLMIEAPSFPGWENFAALLSHVRFVRDHHRRIRRIAVVSDSALLALAPKIASHFVSAKLRTYDTTDRVAALAWIEAGSQAST
jgi:SpoIIAA-like